MIVLGLDPSLTGFGWVILDTSLPKIDWCLARGVHSTTADQLFLTRYIELRELVRSLISTWKPTKVGIESSVFGEQFSEGAYGLFLFTLEALYESRLDVLLLTPDQAKAQARFHLGRPQKWKMKKADMVEAAKKDLQLKGSLDNNIADAYWVGRTASRFWSLYEGLIFEKDLLPMEKSLLTETEFYKKTGKVKKASLISKEDSRFFIWSKVGK